MWKFEWSIDHRIYGGIFKATNKEIKKLIGKNVYLGSYCYSGMYIDLQDIIKERDITLISDNPIVVDEMIEFGYNPLKYVYEE